MQDKEILAQDPFPTLDECFGQTLDEYSAYLKKQSLAYLKKQEKGVQYAGQYIAFINGKLIDVDKDEVTLEKRLIEAYPPGPGEANLHIYYATMLY